MSGKKHQILAVQIAEKNSWRNELGGRFFPISFAHDPFKQKFPLFSVWHVACLAVAGYLVMIEGLFSSSSYQGLQKALDATMMRHEAISSNLANLETPNYKRIDVNASFDSELRRAIGSKDLKSIARIQPKMLVDKNAAASNRDGNTVQLEKEMLALQKNSMAHRLQVQFISGRLAKIKMAIQGKI